MATRRRSPAGPAPSLGHTHLLATLPEEVLLHIITLFIPDPDDRRSVRSTCRLLRDAAGRCFSTLDFDEPIRSEVLRSSLGSSFPCIARCKIKPRTSYYDPHPAALVRKVLRQVPSITELALIQQPYSRSFPDRILQCFASCPLPSLRTLDLQGLCLSSSIAPLSELRSLESLGLILQPHARTFLAPLVSLSALHTLRIALEDTVPRRGLTQRGAPPLEALCLLPALRHLEYGACPNTDHHPLDKLSQITSLVLHCFSRTAVDSVLALTQLRSLVLHGDNTLRRHSEHCWTGQDGAPTLIFHDLHTLAVRDIFLLGQIACPIAPTLRRLSVHWHPDDRPDEYQAAFVTNVSHMMPRLTDLAFTLHNTPARILDHLAQRACALRTLRLALDGDLLDWRAPALLEPLQKMRGLRELHLRSTEPTCFTTISETEEHAKGMKSDISAGLPDLEEFTFE